MKKTTISQTFYTDKQDIICNYIETMIKDGWSLVSIQKEDYGCKEASIVINDERRKARIFKWTVEMDIDKNIDLKNVSYIYP